MNTYNELVFAPMYVVQVEGRQAGLFYPHKGTRLKSAHRKPGAVPFVGASRMNNSITDFADTPVLFPGGWLTLIYNGDGGTGHAKYQPTPFSACDDVIALEPVSNLAKEPALLLVASMLTQQCVPKFGFGYKLTLDRLDRQKIMVPVMTDAEGNQIPDWEGMTRLGEELSRVAAERVAKVRVSLPGDSDTLEDLVFKPKYITDVFETMQAAGKWFDISKAKPFGYPAVPYIARSAARNGVGAFVPHQGYEPPNKGNAITIGVSTSTVFYQPVPFYTSKEIQVLRHHKLSVNSGLILVALLREQMSKFQWGNGASLERLRATRIMVPVTNNSDGEETVDWTGMDLYGHVLRVRAERKMDAVRRECKGNSFETRSSNAEHPRSKQARLSPDYTKRAVMEPAMNC